MQGGLPKNVSLNLGMNFTFLTLSLLLAYRSIIKNPTNFHVFMWNKLKQIKQLNPNNRKEYKIKERKVNRQKCKEAKKESKCLKPQSKILILLPLWRNSNKNYLENAVITLLKDV